MKNSRLRSGDRGISFPVELSNVVALYLEKEEQYRIV
jgi:hypothetical protein